ncbi:hypothetical protein SAMN04488544_2355 [Microlunatus sagamiharensis]|uniref:Uncharacterized protein n=1 Tax=Microlunatus sagamiharensis TaxID=546874 RepID=A0A1H2MN94_9ACTN|nr:hypothetical protein [Microlunatus sagamiharensis]SDU94401.1 hypothetical protein SAMN04488544_2355 [Microlunatus sagamiharensis]
MPPRPPRYAGLEGLYRADAVEVATTTFLHVFAAATVGNPVREGSKVDEIVAWLAGVPLNTGLLGTADLHTWQLLQPYVLETTCLWEQARVASWRTVGSDHMRVFCCLLKRGENVLGSADPYRTMRELLDGVELR